MLKKGLEIEVTVERLAFGGRGVARVNGFVVFVDGAAPAEVVRVLITRVKAQYAEGHVIEVLKPSTARVEPPCPYFGRCGGCKLQHISYEEQLRQKQSQVEETLQHLGGVQALSVQPILPSPEPWGYRNKMEFAIGRAPERGIAIGFHTPGDFRTVLDLERCLLQSDQLNAILEFFRRELDALATREPEFAVPYDPVSHEGVLRHLILRESKSSGQFLAALLTTDKNSRAIPELAQKLIRTFPTCRGFIWGLNRGVSDVARMEEKQFQLGEGWMEERLGDKRYRVSMFSFFQTNSRAAKALYDVVRGFAELSGREQVLDAYCGTGSIGIYLADAAKRVIGIEVVREAVWDARHNAQLNNATNCIFLAGEMREVLPTVPTIVGGKFDRVILDPPRGGMDKRSLKLLIGIGAPILVYVSCNPATLARDTATLVAAGYRPERVQPVDMFPHTHHVETVVKFRREISP